MNRSWKLFRSIWFTGGNATPEVVVRKDIKGRLLTPEEGCGYSKAAAKRIVGGSAAKVGKWNKFYSISSSNRTNLMRM